MTLYINIKKSKDLFEEENEKFSFNNLINNNYFINKLKEMLFKLVPDLANAGKKVMNFCIKLIKFLYEKINEKDSKKINEGFIDSITEAFNSLYDLCSNIFSTEQSKITILDTAELNKMNIEIDEFLKENIIEKETMLIDINDIEAINSFCDLQEVKLFAIKTESNYICMPLDEKDFKGFKAIMVSQYYHSYYHVSDEIFTEINKLIADFIDFLKNNSDFKENKQYQFQNLTVEFEYHEDPSKVKHAGYFSEDENKIVIIFKDIEYCKNNLSDFTDTMIHEYIHHMDSIENKNKFTNWDVRKFVDKIFEIYGNSKIIDLKKLQKELGIKDESAFRYLIGLMQKQDYIEYANKDYTKIRVNIDSELQVIDDDTQEYQDVNYYNDPVELNTHISTQINGFMLHAINDDKLKYNIKQYCEGSYVSDACNYIEPSIKNFIYLPYSFWEKIETSIKDIPDIEKIANEDILFLDKFLMKRRKNLKILKKNTKMLLQQKMYIFNKLKTFKKINFLNFFKQELIKFFNQQDTNEAFQIILSFIKFVFVNQGFLKYLKINRNFKNNNDFSHIINLIKTSKTVNLKGRLEEIADSYADIQTNIYKRKLFGKDYKNKKEESIKKSDKEKIENYYEQVKENYLNILNEKIDTTLQQIIKYMKDQYEETNNIDLDLEDFIIKNNENLNQKSIKKQAKPKKELQKDNLLRQYISLLIH